MVPQPILLKKKKSKTKKLNKIKLTKKIQKKNKKNTKFTPSSYTFVYDSDISVVASVVSLSVVETVLKETKLLVKQRFD